MQTRSGARIEVVDGVVRKLHRIGTDPTALTVRLAIAARLGEPGPGCLLAPLRDRPERVGDRWQTSWPLVETVAPQPDQLPWPEAGRLLARLHAQAPVGLERRLGHGWPARMRRAVRRARRSADVAEVVLAAAVTLPTAAWRAGSTDRPSTLVHGDWHLGQLGRRSLDARWLLIDVDDVGVGDPAWDLARPAGFWAAGLMPDADWWRFLDAYRDAGGAALPAAPADPWPVLEPFARAAVVQAATNHPGEDLLLQACARMIG